MIKAFYLQTICPTLLNYFVIFGFYCSLCATLFSFFRFFFLLNEKSSHMHSQEMNVCVFKVSEHIYSTTFAFISYKSRRISSDGSSRFFRNERVLKNGFVTFFIVILVFCNILSCLSFSFQLIFASEMN